MSRIITSSIIALLLIIASAGGYFYYKYYKNKNQQPESAIPADAAFFMKGSLNSAFNDLQKTVYWQSLDKSELFRSLKSNIILFEKIKNESQNKADIFNITNMTVSFHVTGQYSFDLLYVIPIKEEALFKQAWDNIKQKTSMPQSENERKYEGQVFYELTSGDDKLFTYTISNNLFIGSFTAFLVEDAVRQQKVGKPFGNSDAFKLLNQKLTADSSKYSFYVNYNNFQKFASLFTSENVKPKLLNLSNWAEWSGMNLIFLNNRIVANGYLNSTANTISNSIQNQQPVAFTGLEILPANTAAMQTFSLSNLSEWHKNLSNNFQTNSTVNQYQASLKEFEQRVKVPIGAKFIDLINNEITVCITETSGSNYESNLLAFFKLKDAAKSSLTLKAFSVIENPGKKKLPVENFRKYQIGNIPIDGLLPAIFGSNYSKFKNFFYTINGQYLVVANQPSTIRTYIENISQEKTLKNSEAWKEINNTWLTSFNYSLAVLFPAANTFNNSMLNSNWKYITDEQKSVLGDAKAFIYQVSNNDNGLYAHSSLVFSEKKITGGINLLWTFKPDTTVATPFFLFPGNDDQFIVCQDASFNLYLVNSDGKIVFKKQLEEKIEGDIFKIKLIDNNNLQLLFSTRNKVYALDQNGTNIGSYPIKLPAPSSNGLVYTDSSYFIFCDNNQVYGYDLIGKPLPGWQFNKVNYGITNNISVSKLNGRTYIYFVTQNTTLTVFDINGQKILEKKLNEGCLYKDIAANIRKDSSLVFSVPDSIGSIFNYFIDGTVSIKSTSYSNKVSGFLLNKNENSNTTEMIFTSDKSIHLTDSDGKTIHQFNAQNTIGMIEKFTLKGKDVYGVITTDSKVYLLNSQLKPLKGFPVNGNLIQCNEKDEFFLITLDNSALFYELN